MQPAFAWLDLQLQLAQDPKVVDAERRPSSVWYWASQLRAPARRDPRPAPVADPAPAAAADEAEFDPSLSGFLDQTEFDPSLSGFLDQTEFDPSLSGFLDQAEFDPSLSGFLDQELDGPTATAGVARAVPVFESQVGPFQALREPLVPVVDLGGQRPGQLRQQTIDLFLAPPWAAYFPADFSFADWALAFYGVLVLRHHPEPLVVFDDGSGARPLRADSYNAFKETRQGEVTFGLPLPLLALFAWRTSVGGAGGSEHPSELVLCDTELDRVAIQYLRQTRRRRLLLFRQPGSDTALVDALMAHQAKSPLVVSVQEAAGLTRPAFYQWLQAGWRHEVPHVVPPRGPTRVELPSYMEAHLLSWLNDRHGGPAEALFDELVRHLVDEWWVTCQPSEAETLLMLLRIAQAYTEGCVPALKGKLESAKQAARTSGGADANRNAGVFDETRRELQALATLLNASGERT